MVKLLNCTGQVIWTDVGENISSLFCDSLMMHLEICVVPVLWCDMCKEL
jgi:hypothetical protein